MTGHPLLKKRTPKLYNVRVFFRVTDTKPGRGYSLGTNDEQGGTPSLGETRSVVIRNAKTLSEAERRARYAGTRIAYSEYIE